MILANSSKGLYGFRNEVVLKLLEKCEVVTAFPDDICEKELREEGCKIIKTPIDRRGMNPLKDLKTYRNYKRILREEKPDMVLTYTIKPNVYGGYACRKLKIPYMATITGLGSAFQNEGLVKKLVVNMYRVGLKKAECIFFQNSFNMKIFEECKINGKKSKLVSGSGVNLVEHPFKEYPTDDTVRFLYVGRVLKDKGILQLIDAAKELRNDNISFEIVGECDDDSQTAVDEARDNGYIICHGFQKDVNPYLEKCSALVLPSFYPEGISNVLMEASASGRPILTTNMPGCREVVEDGITGYRFEPRSSESLIEACKKFLKLSIEERKSMGLAARKKMEQEFDRNLVVKDYVDEIYNSIQAK